MPKDYLQVLTVTDLLYTYLSTLDQTYTNLRKFDEEFQHFLQVSERTLLGKSLITADRPRGMIQREGIFQD